MPKSRKDRWEAERREAVAAKRIWPVWSRNLGAMIEAGAIVRFACDACTRVYDVDVQALAILRGREWSLDRARRALQGEQVSQARAVRGGGEPRHRLHVAERRAANLADRLPPARPRAQRRPPTAPAARRGPGALVLCGRAEAQADGAGGEGVRPLVATMVDMTSCKL